MKITQRECDDLIIIDLEGELTLYSSPPLKEMLIELTTQDKINVILNFEKVEYMDSSGLGVLIASLTKFRKKRGDLKLCCLAAPVRMALKLTKLHNMFEIFDSEKEAVAGFQF